MTKGQRTESLELGHKSQNMSSSNGQRVGAAPPPVRLSMVEISEEDAQYHGCVYLFEKHLNDTSYLAFALELVSSSLTFKLPYCWYAHKIQIKNELKGSVKSLNLVWHQKAKLLSAN